MKSIALRKRHITTRILTMLLMLCILLPSMGTVVTFAASELSGLVHAKSEDGGDNLVETPPSNDHPLLDESELSSIAEEEVNNGFHYLEEAPENVAPEQEAVSADGTTIERIIVRWLSSSDDSDEAAGFGRLNLYPEHGNTTNQQFQIDFSLSGQNAYEPGDIEIIFPAYLWLDRYGNEPGELTLSIPEDPEVGVDFVWTRVGDNIVIKNAKKLPAATKVLIQGTFRNVNAQDMVDLTQSHAFGATIIVTTANGQELSMDSNEIDAFIDTKVELTDANKTAYNSNKKEYLVYWNDVPADIPESFFVNIPGNREDYVYVNWNVQGTATGSQPFVMTLKDTVEDKYDGIMLGGISNGRNVASKDGIHLEMTMYDGYNETPRSANIWTAYPKAQFEEGVEIEFNNEVTITVEGKDDHITTAETPSATVPTWSPIQYKFVKVWDDNNNENGVRPGSLMLHIWDDAYSRTKPFEYITMDPSFADPDDPSRWIYTWDDGGQLGHAYHVEEKLRDYQGIYASKFDESGHRLEWIYTLESTKYDPDTHTWEYINVYDDGWVKFELSDIKKYVDERYHNNTLDAATDSAVNDVLRGESAEIMYSIKATLSAAKTSVWFDARPNRFVLEDGTYSLQNKTFGPDDMDISKVLIFAPSVYKYLDYDEVTGWYNRELLLDQTMTLYGYLNGEWKEMAVMYNDVLTAAPGSGASVAGRYVYLPDGVTKVKTEVLSDTATIVDMTYHIYLRLKPGAAMKEYLQSWMDKGDYVILDVFNQANGYIIYEGDKDVDVEGKIYHPNDHVVEITDVATGWVHGRQLKTAADLCKDFVIYANDIINKVVTLRSTLTFTQQTNVSVKDNYLLALQMGDLPNSMSGTYYDLLPYGISPDLTSIVSTTGDFIESAYVIEDWRGSGRTMLVVKVKHVNNFSFTTATNSPYPNDETYPQRGYKNQHIIQFDSFVTWDVIQQYGLDYMRNTAAYEADEDWVGHLDRWNGEADAPSGENHRQSVGAVAEDGELMTGLDGNRSTPSFVYAGTYLTQDNIDMVEVTSLWKDVQANGSGIWASGQRNNINVEEGGYYTYRLMMRSGEQTSTQDIIIIDSIENYIPLPNDKDFGDIQWRGSFVSVDVSNLTNAGVDVIIYYSTVPNLDVSRTAMNGGEDDHSVLNHLLTDTIDGQKVWTTTMPDPSKITAIAIDARHYVLDGTEELDADGNPIPRSFILAPNEALEVYVKMQAPFLADTDSPFYFKGTDGTDFLQNAHAYNEVYLDCLQNGIGKHDRDYIFFNYTKVGIYTKYIEVEKVWDDGENADGFRPEELIVRLMENGVYNGNYVVLNDNNNWKATFRRVHTYDSEGNPIRYTYVEEAFNDDDKYDFSYSQKIHQDGHISVVLNNQHTPEQTSITVEKLWDDNDDAQNARPDFVIIRLLADGNFTGRTLTLRPDAFGYWKGTFDGLNKYRDGGILIQYTIEEEYVEDYVSSVDGYTITNTYYPKGDLTIHKDIRNETASSRTKPFIFDLQLLNADGTITLGTFEYIVYDSQGEVRRGTISSGDEFTLLGGQTIVIKDIPTRVTYTVTEQSTAGFTLVYSDGTSGTIRAGNQYALFINEYSSTGSITFGVSKVLEGHALTRQQFRFILTTPSGEILRTAYNDINGNATFSQIKFTEADDGATYTYYIREGAGGLSYYTYDTTVYTVTAHVYDNGQGQMVCDATYKKGDETITANDIAFYNQYHAHSSLSFRLWKTIDRDLLDGEFSFALFDESFNKIGNNVTNNADGVVALPGVTFNETDVGNTYLYFAKEIHGVDPTVKYSNTIIAYSVTIADNDNGTLSLASQAFDVSSQFDICSVCHNENVACETCNGFGYVKKTNEITLGDAVVPVIHNDLADGSLSVTKYVSSTTDTLPEKAFRFTIKLLGNDVPDGAFTYTVYQVGTEQMNGKIVVPNNIASNLRYMIGRSYATTVSSTNIATIANTTVKSTLNGEWVNGEFTFILYGNEKAVFNDIPAGTIYQVYEEATDGWVLVQQTGTSGIIEPTVELKAEFSNQYQPEATTATLIGAKYLDNQPAHIDDDGNAFEFVLEENGNIIQRITVEVGGFIRFKPLVYDKPGEHVYKIYEIAGTNKNITYDDHFETVTVLVRYDDDNNLTCSITYDSKDGIRFDNKTVPGILEISKVAEGLTNKNKDELFTFIVKLYSANGVPVSGELFNWYVKDSETGEVIDNKIAQTMKMFNTLAVAYTNADYPVAVADRDIIYSGEYGDVVWSIDSDGLFVLEPVNGYSGVLDSDRNGSSQESWDWNEYRDLVKYMQVNGHVVIKTKSTNAKYLFAYMPNLISADIRGLDFTGITELSYMFAYCYNLTSVEASDMITTGVTSLNCMFYNCTSLKTIRLGDLDTQAVTSFSNMFDQCHELETIVGLENFETGNVTSFYDLFQACYKLKTESLKGVEHWDTSHVTTMYKTFANCDAVTELDLSAWNVQNVESMRQMFYDCGNLITLDISGWTKNKNTTMYDMFYHSTNLSVIRGIEDFDVSHVENMYRAFEGTALINLDLKNWNTSSLTTLERTFRNISALEYLDLSGWNVENVESFQYTFWDTSPNLKYFSLEGWNPIHADTAETFPANSKYAPQEVIISENLWTSTNNLVPLPSPGTGSTGKWIYKEEINSLYPQYVYTSEELKQAIIDKTAPAGAYVWQRPSYIVKFTSSADSQGSMPDGSSFMSEDYIIPPNAFTRYGYIFTGWKDLKFGGIYELVDGVAIIPRGTYFSNASGMIVTLEAQWTKISADGTVPYYVSHYQESADGDGRYALTDTIEYQGKPGDTVEAPLMAYPGFRTPEVIVNTIPNDSVLHIAYYYDRTRYTVHFEGNGAEYGVMADIQMIGNIAKVLDNKFQKTASAFLGWNTMADGSGEWYSATSPVVNIGEDGEIVTLYAQWMTIDQSVEATTGYITVQCKAGQTIVIPDLPAGVMYEIEEVDLPKGWNYDSDTGAEGVISSHQTSNATIYNKYIASGQAVITAHKRLTGSTISAGQFEFKLMEQVGKRVEHTELYTDDGEFIEASASAWPPYHYIYEPNKVFTDFHVYLKYVVFNRSYIVVSFNENQSYQYDVMMYLPEEPSKNPDASDTSEHFHDRIEGVYEADFERYGQYCYLANLFTSGSYALDDINWIPAQYYVEFTYYDMIDRALNGTLDEREFITNQDGSVSENPWYGTALVQFDAIEYTKPGEYVYYIKEINDGNSTVDYDEHMEMVRVIVTDNGDGTLSTQVIYEDDNEPEFDNSMKPGDLVVSKRLLNGTDVSNNIDFEFQVFLRDANGIDLTEVYEVLKSDGTSMTIRNGDIVKIKAYEDFTILDLPHGCQYTIVELSKDGFEQSTATSDVGTIVGGQTSYATFTNAYSGKGQLTLTAKKIFVGGPIQPNQFSFQLLDSNYNMIETVYADTNGNVLFTPIDFTEIDVGSNFVYHIQEVVDYDSTTVRYDRHIADIAVAVIDNGDGTIGFEMDYVEDDLTFTNIALFNIQVSKTVTGNMGSKDKQFDFTLTVSNSSYDIGDSVQYQIGNEIGTVSLSNGSGTFKLRHDETITIMGLPFGTEYTITEYANQYKTTVNGEDGKTISGVLNQNVDIAYTNSIISRIPTGTLPMLTIGAPLMLIAIIGFAFAKKRKKS